jgi:hypothetical protein
LCRIVAAAAGGAAGLSTSGVAGAAAGTRVQQAAVTIRPGILQARQVHSQPPTTADCEADYQIACYVPAQIQRPSGIGTVGRGEHQALCYR